MESMLSAIPNTEVKRFYTFAAISSLLIFASILLELFWLPILPAIIIGAFFILKDVRLLYHSFYVVLPFSIEYYVGSIGLDLPSELIMLALTGVGFILLLTNFKQINISKVANPITWLLLLHLSWTFFTGVFAQHQVISLKFFLAKIWYVVPFYFMTFYFIRNKEDVKNIAKTISIFLGIAVMIVLTRHAKEGFSFLVVNDVVEPIFRNHVDYAAIIVTVLPFIWAYLSNTFHAKKNYLFLAFIFIVFILGIYFSYTRAAQLCIAIGFGTYFIFKYRITRPAFFASLIGGTILVGFLVQNNNYLEFAPDFEKTVTHTKFDNLLEATYKMEDISTMERVHRWVAGMHMVGNKPFLGYGPGNFYEEYMAYTVSSFTTYVSDNPEKSGIHNYYLMLAVEQGVLGLLIFLLLVFVILVKGEAIYHSTTDPETKRYIMAACISTVIICSLLIINDLIETDKVGPFFFLNASLLYALSKSEKEGQKQ